MKDSIDFGKVQTYEELKMLRELEKHYRKHPVKHKRKYSKDTSKIKLKGGGWYEVKKRKLTPKQQLFADEYIKSGNAKESAIKAGYSPKTAYSIGNENLKKPELKSYIDAKLAEIESHKIADAKEILEYFTAVLRGETREVVVVATPAGAEEVERAPDEKTKLTAAKELLKRFPMSDEIAKEQLRKIKAEADLAEAKAKLADYEVKIRQEEFSDNEDENRTDDLTGAVQQGMEGIFDNAEIET